MSVHTQALMQCNLGDNSIVCENRQTGTSDWLINVKGDDHAVEGYASQTSVNQNGVVGLHLSSTVTSTVEVEVFRMGWYSGNGARRVYGGPDLGPVIVPNVVAQPVPTPDPTRGDLIECHWPVSIQIPTANFSSPPTLQGPVSGYYLIRLSAPNATSPKAQSYVIFVIREDNRPAKFLMNAAVTTYQAYNCWGFRSFYNCDDSPVATQVSFDRPYSDNQGAGQFFDAFAPYDGQIGFSLFPYTGFEYPMVRFLEREGYDVTYATDIDLHSPPPSGLLTNRAAFLSVGHDEYWSNPMHDNLRAARASGKHVAFFSGNSVYWIINMLPSNEIQPRPNRILQTFKSADPLNPWLWQNCALPSGPNGAPRCTDTGEESEQTLVGSITTDGVIDRGDMQFNSADLNQGGPAYWLVSGTMLHDGGRIPGIIGYEAQAVCGADTQYADCYVRQHLQPRHPVPVGQTRLAHSQFKARPSGHDPEYLWADMSVYQATGGVNAAWVFSAGAPDWSLGLDVFTDDSGNFPSARYLRVHPAIAQMTRNVLAKFGGLSAPDPLIDEAYTATVPGGCFAPGQSFSVHFTAPEGRRITDWRGDGVGGDAVALHLANQSDDFLVHRSLINARGRTSFYETFNTPQAPLPAGTYTADYMTMDLHWDGGWTTNGIRDNLRTIWRGAKSSTFRISTSCLVFLSPLAQRALVGTARPEGVEPPTSDSKF